LGFYDDFLKIAKKQNKGLHGYGKLGVQALIGLGIGYIVPESAHQVSFFNGEILDLGGFYPLFAMLIVIATSNAVNLTDGLDGLAAGTVSCSLIGAMILLGFGLLTTPIFSEPTLLISLCLAASLLGATLGFLMFNRHPARIFMGDCGSLALGGALATLAILGHFEFWLLLIGGLYVVEALSVILQVLSFKTTGKRIFRMSPIHHHFELGGWHETKVVKYFIIFQFLLCLVAVFLYNTK
ncbi:MAG: phospho-N-acetylmuramoyl-pentapeptide-transferase, partial [Cyanobacteria bacterium]|nr:phospho-N-acetylmuramoyl-pentapeptide-transferase [Cyanobacteriota bacterium]